MHRLLTLSIRLNKIGGIKENNELKVTRRIQFGKRINEKKFGVCETHDLRKDILDY